MPPRSNSPKGLFWLEQEPLGEGTAHGPPLPEKNNGKLLKRKIYSDKYFLEIFLFLLTLSKKKNPGTRTQAFIIIVKK